MIKFVNKNVLDFYTPKSKTYSYPLLFSIQVIGKLMHAKVNVVKVIEKMKLGSVSSWKIN